MNRGGRTLNVACAIVTSILWLLVCTRLATAAITTTGSIDPTYDGTDPWVLSSDLIVGQTANARIVVSGGSQVKDITSPSLYMTFIASSPGVTASVTVTGPGSAWETSVLVGEYGHGTMTIENGGRLTAGGVYLGQEVGCVGHFILTGPGTTWEGLPDTKVYPFGGAVAAQGEEVQHFVYATIGTHGTGWFTVSNGARVVSENGLTYLGYFSDGVGHLIVTGPNSVWENTGEIRVGYYGTGTLEVSAGGSVTSRAADISNRGSAIVTGPGSLWHVDGGLYVRGSERTGLLISDGARVESDYTHVDSALVTGPGSVWQNERYRVVGHDSYGWMRIENGGQVTDANAWVGWKQFGDGIVRVHGAGSAWNVISELDVGDAGRGTLTVEEGTGSRAARVPLGSSRQAQAW